MVLGLKQNKFNSLLKIILALFVAYICVYLTFIRPAYKLHQLQTKEWIYDLTNRMICGVNDKTLFNDIRVDGHNITYWYCYWVFNTKKYTIWTFFNLHNKNSNDATINVYSYDHYTRRITNDKLLVNFENIQTWKTNNGEIVIKLNNNYLQRINFKNNTVSLNVNINSTRLEINASVHDFITNQASFIPRYRMLDNIISMNGSATHSPGEWMSDNPYNGAIVNGSFNGDVIESNGVYWFDNYIGCNNYYLEPYIWFVVLNDDWLIYLLWFGEYDTRNKPCTLKAILIKDKKNNKYMYSGCPGIECFKNIPGITDLNIMLSPIKVLTYETECTIGDNAYDKHKLHFETDDITIKISAIEGSFSKVFSYDYYKVDGVNGINPKKEKYTVSSQLWEDKYQKVLNNIRYVEYVGQADVEIEYNQTTTRFKSRQIIDSKYRYDKTIPGLIKFNEDE